MFLRFKYFVTGCCGQDNTVVNPQDVDAKIKLTPAKDTRITTNFRTDTETYETQNICLTTVEDEPNVKAPKLKLIALEGDIVATNKEFYINSKGMEFGGRRRTDGFVYIGRTMLAKNTHTIINDIVLDDPSVGERHCMLRYNNKLRKYFLKDQGEGSGTFIRVEDETKIKPGYIISFSDSHMLLQVPHPKEKKDDDIKVLQESLNDNEKDALVIKFLDGPKTNQTFKFNPKEDCIKIGRMSDCQIRFDGNNLSRYQCTINYRDDGWHISDGLGEKKSTNGTWIFVENFHEIVPSAVIKIGQTLFRADITNQI